MSVSTPAERAKAATRARMLDAGRQLFSSRGLHRVTTHDIARAAGFAPGTFYLHFADKSALFREIAHSTFEDLRRRIESAAAGCTALPETVRARVEALVAYADENRELIRIIFGADTEAAAVEAELLDKFAELIAQGRSQMVAAGQMPADVDPAVLSQALVGMLSRVVRWWVDDPAATPREVVIETLISIHLAGTHPASRER
ncbi:MAG TPA: TetR/AcrR family transcriptional regulator [Terriglobales bacterium]|nr:TetR/AcrR family transcriptional regulator [Terriglobales bacterium]